MAPMPQTPFHVWLTPIVEVGREVAPDQFRFNMATYGFIGGLDMMRNPNFSVGFTGGYTYTHIGWEQNLGKGNDNAFYLGTSFAYVNKGFYCGTFLQWAMNFYSIDRNIYMLQLNKVASLNHITHDFLSSLEMAYTATHELAPWLHGAFKPRLNLSFVQCYSSSFSEKGAGVMDLCFDSKNRVFFRALIDFTFRERIQLHMTDLAAIPEFALGLMRTVPIGTADYAVNWNKTPFCEPNYTMQGYSGATILGTLELKLGFEEKECLHYGLRYFLSVGKEYINNEGTVEFTYDF